jgi:hypothetical protein
MDRSWRFYSRKVRAARCAAVLAPVALCLAGCAQLQWALPGQSAPSADAGDVTGGIGRPSGAALSGKPARLADADWAVAQQAIRDAIDRRSPDAMPWINPETGTMGTVAFRSDSSLPRDCAGFDLAVLKGETAERFKGQACRSPKGGMRVEGLRAASER